VSSSKNVEMSPATHAIIMAKIIIVANTKQKNMDQWRLLVNAFVKRLLWLLREIPLPGKV
jgi:hypothetical protein